MKTLLKFITAAAILFSLAYAQKQETSVLGTEGVYNGKNILVRNSYGPGGIGYCIVETKVNGKVTKDEINANLFQIKLDALDLKLGEKVRIEIKFLEGCAPHQIPLILNPDALNSPTEKKESVLIVDGKYKWMNLFVTNPRIGDGHSIREVKVNDKVITVNVNSDFIEINLMALGLQEVNPIKDGEEVLVEIMYQTGYDPIIINPEAVQ